MIKETLLIEIGTEELPPRALNNLSEAFSKGIETELKAKKLQFSGIKAYATPRRLALVISDLQSEQEDYTNERRGPAAQAAMKDGNPTPALQGFARSCGVEVDQLTLLETDKGAWYTFKEEVKGESLESLLPEMIEKSLKGLPIPKRMRWANHDFEFVRPVRWLAVVYSDRVLNTEIFGIKAGNVSRGHRFHTNAPVEITNAANYEAIMEKSGHIVPDFAKRKAMIEAQIADVTNGLGTPIVNAGLLDEVTALVEYPNAMIGSFESHFLDVPQEALIIAMEDHQRYFPIVDQDGKLVDKFCFISNIVSEEPEAVVAGNERVIRPRFADAEFFWNEDKAKSLESYLADLENVVFQTKLGAQADKINRVKTLAEAIASQIGANDELVSRAARLNKADLISDMVQEFPELQGTMARYYANFQGEDAIVADSLEQVYWPRVAGDKLPETKEAQALGLAERLDTIVGIFSIGEIPTGSRDPYGLRRNALAVLRILIEKELNLDLLALIKISASTMPASIDADKSVETIFTYIFDRLRAYSADLGVSSDVFTSISELKLTNPLDIYHRLLAVAKFKALPAASSLIETNKRIHNILDNNKGEAVTADVSEALLENDSEKVLFAASNELKGKIESLAAAKDYPAILQSLSNLAEPLANFFADTMVMADDLKVRHNRIALLTEIRDYFETVADISKLQLA